MTEYNETLVTFASGVLVPFILFYLRQRQEKRKQAKQDKLHEEIQFSSIINAKLDTLREEYKADRVWLTQFHNGGHYYPTGKSIQKFSIFYESVSPYADSVKMSFQNIPISLFAGSTNELLQNDMFTIPDFKEPNKETYGLHHIADLYNTKSSYHFAVKTIDGKFIGVLGLDFTKRKTELDNESLNYLLVEASSIGGVLMNYLKDK